MSRFQFVDDHRDTYEVKWLCDVVDVARSSYYYWVERAAARGAKARDDLELAARIKAIQDPAKGGDKANGRPRVTAELNDGIAPEDRINHKRVGRVMREHNLPGIRIRKKVRTTIPAQSSVSYPDLCERNFDAEEVNTKYVGDITYIPIVDGSNLYLASVIDCRSRKLAGWALDNNMRTQLVVDALEAARADRGSLEGAIFHSDHGSVYTSKAYGELCSSLGVVQSMGSVGSSADNALAESFNAALKRELLAGRPYFDSVDEARLAIFRWATRYNTKRRHSYCGNVAPNAFELSLAA